SCARCAGVPRLPEGAGRQPDADRLRRGVPRAAERHGGRAGKPAAHDRGQEVLRSAEEHLADRPHRRLAADGGLGFDLEQALGRGQEDLRRHDARGRREVQPRDRGDRSETCRGLQEARHQRDHGGQERLPRRGPQDHEAGRPGLSPGRLRQDRQPEVMSAVPERSIIDDLPQVMGEDGEFHATDEAVDFSGVPWEAWVALGFFWILGLTVFYQFVTRYVMNDSASWTEEIARYLLIATVFTGAVIGVAKNNHIQVDFFYRHMPAKVGFWLSRLVDVLLVLFF